MYQVPVKLGVIGLGVVGSAIFSVFQAKGVSTWGYDKYQSEWNSVDDWLAVMDCPFIMVCVPSPTNGLMQDLSSIRDVFGKLSQSHYNGIVLLKSTVLPGTTERLGEANSLRVLHCPEFLTAKTPHEDFEKCKVTLLGGNPVWADTCKPLFQKLHADMEFGITDDPAVTEMAKYMHNLFLASKVAFSNEIFGICDRVGVEYPKVIALASKMGGISPGHTQVPGPDGKRGYGGMCFPKDTKAFLGWANSQGLPMLQLAGTIWGNSIVRPDEPVDEASE